MKKRPKRSFFSPIGNIISPASTGIRKRSNKISTNILNQLRLRPITSFLILLVILFSFIFLTQTVFKPKPEVEEVPEITKEVETFQIGKSPTINIQGQIQKSGVVQITAQAPGIVSKIPVSEGKIVERGTLLLSTANNYQGANIASVQKQLAQTQYASTKNTFQLQKAIINKQRELADKSDSSSDELRDITSKSLDETRGLISLNENIIGTIDTNLKTLEDTNAGGVNDSLILQTKQLKAQLLSGLNQAKSGLRSAEFSADSEKSPAQISNISKELTKKQLDLQEKSLELGLETSRLQLKLAQISESVMYPTSPVKGVVQRVHVKIGQSVSPGTPLVTLSTDSGTTTAVALVTANIAQSINKLENSFLIIGNQKIESSPIFISTEATNGQLYSVIYLIPDEYKDLVTDQGFIDIEVPTGKQSFATTYPFVPLDSVHQTQDSAVVFIVNNAIAEGKNVTLGEVQGNFVQIISGLTNTDTVIINRNIITGDKVKITAE